MENKTALLLPKAKTWMLMSKTGLGDGASTIYNSSQSSLAASLGFKNNRNTNGIVLVNDEYSDKEVSVTLNNVPLRGDVYARAYLASGTSDGSLVVGTNKLTGSSTMTFKVAIPAQSVVGVTLTNEATLQEKVKSIIF